MGITPRSTYISVGGLFALAALSLAATYAFEKAIGGTDLHGPVGLVVAIPLAAGFALGAGILAAVVLRAKLPTAPTIVGLLPVSLVFCGLAAVLLLLAAG